MKNHHSFLLAILISSVPFLAYAVSFEEIIVHKPSTSRPFWGNHYEYKNIDWISHVPHFEYLKGLSEAQIKEVEQEWAEAIDERGQIDIGSVDFNDDGQREYLKVIWTAYGGPARGLVIEVYADEELQNKIASIDPQKDGYHPNFKIDDIDGDNSLELITFSGVSDPNMSNLYSDDKPFEGRFSNRALLVSIFKYKSSRFELDRQYVTNNKYEPHFVPDEGVLPE